MESLTAQTYPNFEIILIDDGSPDNCPAICDEFEKHHDNIRVIHQQNKGISGTRNTGIDAANGELITFIDSDDSVHPELLERLYQLMEKSGAGISSVSACKGKTAAGRLTSGQAIKCLLKENTTLNTSAWGKLFKKELFAQLRFPEDSLFEDYALIPLLIDKANYIVHSDEILYNYRMDNLSSITKSAFNPAHMQYFTVSEGINLFLKEQYPNLRRYAGYRNTRYAVSFFKKAAGSPQRYPENERRLTRYVRAGIIPYLFSQYKLTSKAYGLLIAVCPPLARRLFAR